MWLLLVFIVASTPCFVIVEWLEKAVPDWKARRLCLDEERCSVCLFNVRWNSNHFNQANKMSCAAASRHNSKLVSFTLTVSEFSNYISL